MKNAMEYKGYLGKVDYDDHASVFHGEVINTRDVITFQGASVAALKRAFRDSIDDYLAFCAERGESPDKPFSGQFVTRISPELHRGVHLAAALAGQSLNAWVTSQLAAAVQTQPIPASRQGRVKAKQTRGSATATRRRRQ